MRIKALFILFTSAHRIILVSRLFKEKKYNEIVCHSKKWLDKNETDFIAIRSISFAYAYIGKSDEGFIYLSRIIHQVKSDKLIEKFIEYFIYPEVKKRNFNTVFYRCLFF
jgi:hypothetical protein